MARPAGIPCGTSGLCSGWFGRPARPWWCPSIVLRLFRALLPLATLWVAKLILDAAVDWVTRGRGTLVGVWKLVALELGLAIASDVLGRANTLLDSLLGDRFTNRISVRLMEHSTALDLASFEDPVFYDKLERARKQTTGRMGLLASLLGLGQDFLSLVSLSAGLIFFSPWLMALLVAAVVPAFLGETHFTTLAYSALFRKTPQRRLLDYLRLLGASTQSAKEVKIFGLGRYLSQRYHEVSESIYIEHKELSIRRAIAGSALNVISTGGYYGAYAVVLLRYLAGGISVGNLTFLTGAFSRSRGYIERILLGFTDISDQAIFLKDLFEFFAMEPSIRSKPNAIPGPRPIREGFEFRNVAFAYPGTDRRVVNNLNFRLQPLEQVALIGERMELGDNRGEAVGAALRSHRGQYPSGWHGPSRVRRGRTAPGDRRDLPGLHALRHAGPREHRFRPDRKAGRPGSCRIRGGQEPRKEVGGSPAEGLRSNGREAIRRWRGSFRRRVAKTGAGARLHAGRQVLMLDEPTATLDARAEYEVFQRFADLTRGRMAVLISHRFSTVCMANRILVLAGGEIRERGTHEELVALGGRYAELFELQAAGYR